MYKTKAFVMLVVFMMMMSMSMGVLASNHEGGSDIVDTAVAADDFNTLVAAVQEAGLVDPLKGEGPFTVFAPTDAVFANLLSELGVTAEELLAREDLADILLYHVVSGNVKSTDLVDGMEVETLNGQTVTISLNPAQVNGANIVTADIEASNGVIHVIDAVLVPATEEAPAPESPQPEEGGLSDIVDTAVAAGSFTTLVATVQEAGLVDALKGEGPFTVFAPTDEAFAKLLNDLGVTAEELLAREDLADILLYHVVSGNVKSTDLVDGMEAETLNGQKVLISLNPVQVNDANVVTADIETSNGVIHVIDAVLVPAGEADTPAIPKTGDSSMMVYVALAIAAAGGFVMFIRKGRAVKA